MKIYYWTPYLGNVGTIKATIYSAVSMKRLGHTVKLYKLHREWEGYEDILKQEGIEIIDFGICPHFNLPTRGKKTRLSMLIISIGSYRKLRKNWELEKPDVIMAYLLGYFPLMVRRRCIHKPKIINSIQGKPVFHGFRKKLWNRYYTNSDWIISLTERTRTDFLYNIKYDAGRVTVVPNPIINDNIDVLSNELIDEEFSNINVPVIIGVGRLTKQKDFSTLITAFHEVQKDIDCHLWILGEGEQYDSLAALIQKYGLTEKVKLFGFVKNPYKYMKIADIFVLSSLWEDAGHVLVEAAYLKLKLVSTRCPYGQEEFLNYGELGELCNVSSTASMKEAILKALDPSMELLWNKRCQLAHDKALKFDITHHGEVLNAILGKL